MKKTHIIFIPLIVIEVILGIVLYFSTSQTSPTIPTRPPGFLSPFVGTESTGLTEVVSYPSPAFYIVVDLLILTSIIYVIILIINLKNKKKRV